MVKNQKKWALGGVLLFVGIVLFLTWAVLSPSYEEAKRFSEELGDKPYVYESPKTSDDKTQETKKDPTDADVTNVR